MRFLQVAIVGLGLSFGYFAKAADVKKFATVEVTADDAAAAKAKGIRTLFLIVYDANNPRPMPYGAMKVDLKADAKGTIFKGDLTTENVTRMMDTAPFPTGNIKVKARLDKDGSAGMDQPEDISAVVEGVKVGDKIKIALTAPH